MLKDKTRKKKLITQNDRKHESEKKINQRDTTFNLKGSIELKIALIKGKNLKE